MPRKPVSPTPSIALMMRCRHRQAVILSMSRSFASLRHDRGAAENISATTRRNASGRRTRSHRGPRGRAERLSAPLASQASETRARLTPSAQVRVATIQAGRDARMALVDPRQNFDACVDRAQNAAELPDLRDRQCANPRAELVEYSCFHHKTSRLPHEYNSLDGRSAHEQSRNTVKRHSHFLRKAAPTVDRDACHRATQGFTIAPDLRRIC